MLKAKEWDILYKKSFREGFKTQLIYEIRGLTGQQIIWSDKEDKPWFTCQFFTSHVSPEDVLRSLELLGIDQDGAHFAVDQMFM